MINLNYHEIPEFGTEPCPALYIEVSDPKKTGPFLKDHLAQIDTGSDLTCLPVDFKEEAKLIPFGRIAVRWKGISDRVPGYWVQLSAEGCKPRLIAVVFSPFHQSYCLLGRNLLKNWILTLHGPESRLEISDS